MTTATNKRLDNDTSWIQTFSGKAFFPLDPNPDDIDIVDIAHALSNQCRYLGHTKRFYSVAEHAVHISQAAPPEYALWGLLHDASEAYLCDVPKPIKPLLTGYKEIENRLMSVIAAKFGLALVEPPIIKELDTRILHNEREALMSVSVRDWSLTGEPIPNCPIFGWSPEKAEAEFLNLFELLKGWEV